MATQPRPAQHTLFGLPEPARPVPGSVRTMKANGYAAPPGSGPAGETCGSCAHCRVREHQPRRFYKCAVMLPSWSNCRSSDVLVGSPACKRWEAGTPQPTHIHTRHQGD